MERKKRVVPREVCAESSERSNHRPKAVLNVQKYPKGRTSAEVIVVSFFFMKGRINRSLKYDRERRNDRLWQKT